MSELNRRSSEESYQATTFKFDVPGIVQENALRNGVRLLNDVEKAWLAAVIDGEGSILVAKIAPRRGHYRRGFYYRANLEVANSNKSFLDRVRDVIGKGSVALGKENNPQWKDKWQYSGSSLVLRGLLPQILPHLLIKREIAGRMLEYLSFVDANPLRGHMQVPSTFDERRDSLYWAIKRLNRRGADPSSEPREDLLPRSWGPKHRGVGSRTTDCRKMNESERVWLAGVIDGEGSIFLSKVREAKCRRGFFYLPSLAVSNTNRAFLVRVAEIVGEGTVYLSKRGNMRWKTRWTYLGTAGVLRSVLPQTLSYMIVKRALAEKMVEFLVFIDQNSILGLRSVPASYYEKLDPLYWAIKKLNEKGRKPVFTSTQFTQN